MILVLRSTGLLRPTRPGGGRTAAVLSRRCIPLERAESFQTCYDDNCHSPQLDVPNPRMPTSVAPGARFRPHPRVRMRQVAGEAVLLHLDRGEYFTLNATGTRV